jgi:Fe-S cluster assembly scaffold IscU
MRKISRSALLGDEGVTVWWDLRHLRIRCHISRPHSEFCSSDAKLTIAALLDHYSRPRNVGSMSKTDVDVGTGLVGAPACGDVMKLQIRVDPSNNTIADVKFKTFGCGSAIASSSYLTELVRGMTLEQASKIRNTEIAKELCLPPVKCECFLSDALVRGSRKWDGSVMESLRKIDADRLPIG